MAVPREMELGRRRSWAVLDGVGDVIGGEIAEGDFGLRGGLAGKDGAEALGGMAGEEFL